MEELNAGGNSKPQKVPKNSVLASLKKFGPLRGRYNLSVVFFYFRFLEKKQKRLTQKFLVSAKIA